MSRAPRGGISAADLERSIARPAAFAPHDAPFWDDPHIARQMLAAHLDPATDAASRRPDTIARTVEHLRGALGLRRGDRLLDLGCGPGLYATAFARHGVLVHGIDLSSLSIDHAMGAARDAALPIEYRVGDYTAEPLGGPYEAAVMIYLDFGVLPDEARDRLLDAVRTALIPGGAFAFDVYGTPRPRVTDAAISVERSAGGFWRPDPHLVIETTYRVGANLDVNQYAIVTDQDVITYRVWDHAYSVGELRTLLRRHGLRIDAVWSDLTGAPFRRASPTIAVLARSRARR